MLSFEGALALVRRPDGLSRRLQRGSIDLWMAEETMKLVVFAGTVGFVAVVGLSLLAVADILLTQVESEAEKESLA